MKHRDSAHRPEFWRTKSAKLRERLVSTVIKPSVCSIVSRLPRHRQTGVVPAQRATGRRHSGISVWAALKCSAYVTGDNDCQVIGFSGS